MPGDSLVVYTDGVIDAQNQDEALFGDANLVESLERNRDGGAEAMLEGILNDLRRFVGGAPQFDDITLLVLSKDG
jgi:sigma-B regulation protein RsbU (phosphoserine phosphatase)